MIKKYLKNITNGKEINYNNFKSYCQKLGITSGDLKLIFTSSGMGNNKYVLTIKNKELYESIFSKFYIEDENTKVSSALQGNSKKSKSPYSVLTVKGNHDDLYGVSLIFKDEECLYDFHKKNKLIIIENANLFCDIISFFINSDINLSEYNFAFGSGNSVTDKNFYRFFDDYEEIICLFDIDLGGFKFYKSLSLNLKTKLKFYFDDENEKKLELFGRPITNEEYLKMNSLYSCVTGLKEIISIVNKQCKFAEQEIFQHDLMGIKNDI
jgi:hypothetical protein